MKLKKLGVVAMLGVATLSSCVSKKSFTALESQCQKLEAELSTARMALAGCEDDKKKLAADNTYLREQANKLMNSVNDLAIINIKEAENLERSLEALKEKDSQIKRLSEARSKKDSVTLALVTSLKGVLGNMDDEDIQINVEKGVVFISIADKLLFKSGSYEINTNAKAVLAKVAKVVNNKPGMDVMVEGHTDTKAVIENPVLKDNWDLSVYRATAVVRVLQDELGVDPARLIPAGRSFYVPVADNESAEGRSLNRRTRIIILPKLDEFYGLIDEGMKQAQLAE